MTGNEERLLNLILHKGADGDIRAARDAVLAERVDPKLVETLRPLTDAAIRSWNAFRTATKGLPQVLVDKEIARFYKETDQ